jgi:two-component system cell cycle response regulator DivK
METVLLVEDDIGNQMVVEDIFQFDNVGAGLAIVGSAEEALQFASESSPILILMDIRLPGMNGLEATRALKSDPRTRDIPVWALTAYARREDGDKALAAGCDDYIRKPFRREELVAKLREFVESSSQVGAT